MLLSVLLRIWRMTGNDYNSLYIYKKYDILNPVPYNKIKKQSRLVCVKCQLDRELPAGRKGRNLSCGTQTASRCEEDRGIISFVVCEVCKGGNFL